MQSAECPVSQRAGRGGAGRGGGIRWAVPVHACGEWICYVNVLYRDIVFFFLPPPPLLL